MRIECALARAWQDYEDTVRNSIFTGRLSTVGAEDRVDLVVPPDEASVTLRAELLDEIHRQPSTAHPGRNKMHWIVQDRFYWLNLCSEVDDMLVTAMTAVARRIPKIEDQDLSRPCQCQPEPGRMSRWIFVRCQRTERATTTCWLSAVG